MLLPRLAMRVVSDWRVCRHDDADAGTTKDEVSRMMSIVKRLFRASRSRQDVIDILERLLRKTVSDAHWDAFISVKILDPELEEVRSRVASIWTADSPYMVQGSTDPTDLNPLGMAEVRELIRSLEHTSYPNLGNADTALSGCDGDDL